MMIDRGFGCREFGFPDFNLKGEYHVGCDGQDW